MDHLSVRIGGKNLFGIIKGILLPLVKGQAGVGIKLLERYLFLFRQRR